jgi:hypothetical protein
MTKPDRQKLGILAVLLAVLGLTILLGYRMNQPTTTAAVQTPEQPKTSANPPAPSDARIRLDLVEKQESDGKDIGKKNVFQYGQTPLPVLPGPKPGATNGTPPPTVISTPLPIHPVGPPLPPPPPPIPLKYQGYAATKTPDVLTAFLVDDTRPNDIKHFNVGKNEVLMGRYRMTNISVTSVEIEDLEYNRRQVLPLLK